MDKPLAVTSGIAGIADLGAVIVAGLKSAEFFASGNPMLGITCAFLGLVISLFGVMAVKDFVSAIKN